MLKTRRLIELARNGDLWPAIRWQLRGRYAVVRERYYRLRLGLGPTVTNALPSITRSGSFSASPESERLRRCFEAALRGESVLAAAIRRIEGMSGQSYRSFINNYIGASTGPRYLEVGSWAGSTAAAALFGNEVAAICIDNWSEFGGPRDAFFANIKLALSDRIDFRFLEKDFRAVDFGSLGAFDIYLFDGPHAEPDQYDGVVLAQPALTRRHLLIVDDWNWRAVRNGTFRALIDSGCRVATAIEVRTTLDDSHPEVAREKSEWHNGYFLAVVEKGR